MIDTLVEITNKDATEDMVQSLYQCCPNDALITRVIFQSDTSHPKKTLQILVSVLSNPDKLIEAAIDEKRSDVLDTLFQSDIPFMQETYRCDAWLVGAFLKHDMSSARVLIDHGASVNSLGDSGQTPLTFLCARSEAFHAEIDMLLQNGAEPNVMDSNNQTPLISAIRNKHLEIVQLLITQGANVNLPDKRGSTPLHHCVEANNLPCLDYLLTCGANTAAKDNGGETPLLIALQFPFDKLLVTTVLENTQDVNVSDNSGFTPLMMAVANDADEEVELLLQRGADINQQDSLGYTATMVAFANANINAAQKLVHLGCIRGTSHASGPTWTFVGNALTIGRLLSADAHFMTEQKCTEMNELFFGSGETIFPAYVPEPHAIMRTYLESHKDMTLSGMCRYQIREHLKQRSRVNLITQVGALPLPSVIKRFLTFQ